MTRRIFLVFLVALIVLVAGGAYAATTITATKTWSAEKLYAADLNARFVNIESYLNTNIASWTDITASAAELNQLDGNIFTTDATFRASLTIDTLKIFTVNGRAKIDSLQADTLQSASTGTIAGASFFMLPRTDGTGYFGTPGTNFRSAALDTLHLNTKMVGSVLDSGNVVASGIGNSDIANDAVDSTKVGPGELAGSDLASVLSGNHAWTGTATWRSGTDTLMAIDASGRITAQKNPCFQATASAQANVTGDGTVYTILWATEVFDRGANFASNTFTAPVTGTYDLRAIVYAQGLTANHTTMNFQITTSNRDYDFIPFSPAAVRDVNNEAVVENSVLADMDANDTAVVKLYATATDKTIDIGATTSRFMGRLTQ